MSGTKRRDLDGINCKSVYFSQLQLMYISLNTLQIVQGLPGIIFIEQIIQ